MKSHTELGLPVVKLKDTYTEQASYTLSQYLAFDTDKESLFKKSKPAYFYLSLSILVTLSFVPRLQLLITAGLHKTILKALLMSVRGVFAQDAARGVRLLCQCFE